MNRTGNVLTAAAITFGLAEGAMALASANPVKNSHSHQAVSVEHASSSATGTDSHDTNQVFNLGLSAGAAFIIASYAGQKGSKSSQAAAADFQNCVSNL